MASASLDYELTLASVAELAVPELPAACAVVLADPASASPRRLRGAAHRGRFARPVPPRRADDGRAGASPGRSRSRARRAPTTRRTCSSRRTSRCAPARRWRTRGSTRPRRRSRARCRPRCCRPSCPTSRASGSAAAYRPAGQGLEVGGDFYDVFSTGEGQWHVVVGDVCGKGAEAAAVTALARYTLPHRRRAAALTAAILRWVDEAMLAQDVAGGRFCTIACVHLDLARRPRRPWRCGGHPLPVLRQRTGSVELFGEPGTLLGLLGDLELPEPRRAAVGRLARALHGRAHRARAPLAHVGRGRADGRRPQRPVGRAGRLVDASCRALGDRSAPRDDLAVLAVTVV